MDTSHLTPHQIVEELDKYIIGQDEAKRCVAIALRNRWRRMNASPEIRNEIIPNNILMIGPTGVGKTEIARRLAKLADAPFVKVEASKYTEVGYVGRDVESMVRDLVEHSVNMVKEARKEEVKIKAEEMTEEKILDILIPPVRTTRKSTKMTDVTAGVMETFPIGNADEELNEKTREKFREKLKKGELDKRKIEIDITSPVGHVQVVGPMGTDEMSMNIQEMLSGMVPKKTKKRSFTVAEARPIIMEEEAQKLIDMDAVVRDALDKAQSAGIIFIDEIDKIAGGGSKTGGPDVSREGVQRDLLPIVEGSTVNTKYGVVKTDHVLFVAAGAFHSSKPSDLIPELQGRFPIRTELNSLTKKDFVQILKQPKNALTKQYAALLQSEGVKIEFDKESLEEIASTAYKVNTEVENIGARRLHTIMSTLLNQHLFDIPDKMTGKDIRVTKEMVKEKLSKITGDKELSKYIL